MSQRGLTEDWKFYAEMQNIKLRAELRGHEMSTQFLFDDGRDVFLKERWRMKFHFHPGAVVIG